jgi:FkbM family methyltransferase
MYIYADNSTAQEYLARPYEPGTAALLERLVRPGAIFVDIGAQFGYFTLIGARAARSTGRVYAFEPEARNFRLLERNIALNRLTTVMALQRAVGDRAGIASMFVYGDSDSHSLYRHPDAAVRETISVPVVALDDVLQDQTVDVIKIDIEGHEPRALTGMQQTIARNPNVVLITELAPVYLRRGGTEPSDYLRQIESLGLRPLMIDEATGDLRPIKVEPEPSWKVNLLCQRT